MTDDLAVWLAAQIDADERTAQNARGAGSGEWRTGDHAMDECRIDDTVSGVVVFDEGAPTKVEADHIAEHDPARELREVEAKRRRLARHTQMGNGCCSTCREHFGEYVSWPCVEILDDASVYAGRPGWREEWAA